MDVRLIDANRLLKKLQEQQKHSSVTDSRGRAKAIVELIHAQTVDAVPVKRGKWIVPPVDSNDRVYCSVCGWRPYGDLFTDFCAGCGAYMYEVDRCE